MGDDCVVFGSDYPHWDCGFPGAVQRCAERNLSSESIDKIFWDNGVRLHSRITEAPPLPNNELSPTKEVA